MGPIGVLCIRRTLDEGRRVGFASGLGAATADAFYGGVGGLGLTVVSSVLIGQSDLLRLIGGAFLCYLGLRTFAARPAAAAPTAAKSGHGLAAAYASTLALTLTNPATILSFAAVFAGLGVVHASASQGVVGVLVLGVFAGSTCWWLLLTSGVSLVRTRLTAQALRWVNRIAGLVLLAFGMAALLSLLPLGRR